MAVHSTQQVQRLEARPGWPQAGFPWHVGSEPVRVHRLVLAVESEDRGAPPSRAQQPEQQSEQGCLPGPIWAEDAQHLAVCDLEVEVGERAHGAELLGQP
jgi:hypothetical protein